MTPPKSCSSLVRSVDGSERGGGGDGPANGELHDVLLVAIRLIEHTGDAALVHDGDAIKLVAHDGMGGTGLAPM